MSNDRPRQPDPADLVAMARDVIDGNHYLTLGTTEPDGLPRLSPVYFTHDAYRVFYWVSAPDAQHSQNLLRQPSIAIVIFDSSLAPGSTQAVYLTASAEQVPEPELPTGCAIAFRAVGAGARGFGPEELSGDASLRLYRANATSLAVHVRGGHPEHGTGVDRRLELAVPLPER
jgi:hypothetical protein